MSILKTPFRYDFVGSFLRPEKLKQAKKDFSEGKITEKELNDITDECVRDIVTKQKAAGFHAITDGEFRRRWWHLDWLKEFDGFDTIHFTKEINGMSNEIELGTVTGKIFYDKNKVHPEVEAWDYLHRLASQYEGVTAKKCISGEIISCKKHKWACERFLRDAEKFETDPEYPYCLLYTSDAADD